VNVRDVVERAKGLPALRLRGAELADTPDGIFVDWDEYDEFISRDAVLALLAESTPAAPDAEGLRAALDEALRPYLDLLLSPPAQNDKIIRGVASRLGAALASQNDAIAYDLAGRPGERITDANGDELEQGEPG
jgi:hypothetical protein